MNFKDDKLNINIILYIFINIASLVLINDYLTYFISCKYIISVIISLFAIVGINLLFRKKIKIVNDFSKSDFVFLVILGGLIYYTIPFPDRSFDTFNYHLYLQEKPFGDKILYDFFAGKNVNSFSYAFPDRMFYLFRFFLGYRVGTILNYFILVVIYYEVKSILKKLIQKPNDLLITIFSIISIFSISILDIVDSYYVDLISLVFLLILFNIMVLGDKLDNSNKKSNLIQFVVIGLLYGFTFATKISNAPLLVLLFVIYLCRNINLFKCLNIKNVICTCVAFIFPFILYMAYTYIQTGNPVFPFYNTIFHSEYYANVNWMDTRFGPHRWLEAIQWPLMVMEFPERLVDQAIAEPMWCIGFISAFLGALIYSINFLRKKIDFRNNHVWFYGSIFLSFIVWAKFQLGYSRYGLIVLLLGNVAFCLLLYFLYEHKMFILISVGSLYFVGNIIYSVIQFAGCDTFWIYNNYYNNSIKNYEYNKENLFYKNDIQFTPKENSAWGIFYANSGYTMMFNSDMPLINMIAGVSNERTANVFDNLTSKYDHIYTVIDSLDYINLFNTLKSANYKVVDIPNVYTSKILGKRTSFAYVFEVEKCEDICNQESYSFNTEITLNKNDFDNLWFGLPKDDNTLDEEAYYIEIHDGKNVYLEEIPLDGTMKKININKDDKSSDIKFILKYKNNKVAENMWAMLLYN